MRIVHHPLAALTLLSAMLPTALPLRAQDLDEAGVARRPPKSLTLGVGASVPIRVLYTNLPGDPTADVPGLPGVHFGPGTGTTHFDRVFGSTNGHWAITADTDLPISEDEVLLADDEVLAREGTPTPWNAAENFGLLDTDLGVNNDGFVLFATNTDGAAAADEYIVAVSSTVPAFPVIQEGQPIGASIPGATWGSTLDTPRLASETALVSFSADLILGVPTTEDDLAVVHGLIEAREGITIPAGQLGTETWENFDLGSLWVDAQDTTSILAGDLTGNTATDDVAVVDGTVVVQEGTVLPGSGFSDPVDLNGIVEIHMAPDGTWFVRGNNSTSEQDWIYSNGAVLTTLGDPIFTGSPETWSDAEFADCYFLHVGDGRGNYIVGGVSNGPTATNGVLTLNETWEVVREGDALDLDGNGVFDDDTFFDTFGNDDGYLSDDGWFYFVATIQDGTDTRIGQGLFRADLRCLIGGMPFNDGFESGDTSAWCFSVE